AGALTAASDSGVSNTDNITNITTPVFAGTTKPNATVQLFAQAASQASPVLVGSVTAGSNGQWAIITISLADGQYTITATVTDPVSGTTASAQVLPGAAGTPLVIDTVPPTVTGVTYNRVSQTLDNTFQ